MSDTKAHKRFYLSRALMLFIIIFGVLLLGRSYEIMVGIWNFGSGFANLSYLLTSVIRDFQFGVVLTPVILLFSWGVGKVQKPRVANQATAHLIVLASMANMLLITYYGATRIPLGAEFWAYSMTEMTNTVIAAEQVTVISVGYLIIVYLLIYFLVRKLLQSRHLFKEQPNRIYGL
ncbi:MAG: hypothetical protein GWN62_18355, partial [Aliifodinibius sp.]|nr:hypothetical protein [Fodinibius sp.]